MKELLVEFLNIILSEGKPHEPNTTWQTPSGNWSAKNSQGETQTGFTSDRAAKKWLAGGGTKGQTADKPSRGKTTPAKTTGRKATVKPAAKKVTAKPPAPKKQAKAPKKAPADGDTPKKKQGKKAEPGVTNGMIDPNTSGPKIVSQLLNTNEELAAARRRGRAGAGGQKASYGEVALTQAANSFRGDGFAKFVRANKAAIKAEIAELTKPLTNKREINDRERKIRVVAEQLGLDPTNDRDKVIRYLATRTAYVNAEMERLRADESSVLYLSNGFNNDEEAAEAWARAQFDGAITTLQLTAEDSKIDTTKPFTVIQAEGRNDSHDGAIKDHLRAQIAAAKTEEDRKHYEEQLYVFEHLGFHDTMVVGVDENDRLTVYHITNKKGNDLEDIWNNTGPLEAIKTFQESFARDLADVESKQTAVVGNVLTAGIRAVEDATGAAGVRFAEMTFDANDDFVKAVVAISSGDKDYTKDALPEDGNGIPVFERTLQERGDSATLKKIAALKSKLKAKGPEGIKARLAYIKIYSEWVNANSNDEANPLPKSLKITGKMIRIVTKVAEELPKLRKQFGEKFGATSSAVEESVAVKRTEKELMEQLHLDITKAIKLADERILGKDKASKENGPHTRAYLGTVMASMHFDSMIINFDGHLGAVTGIRGSRPSDFRECLAEMSDYTGDVSSPKGRKALVDHLLKTCKINPTTYAIEITNKTGTHTLAEDSWRTSGTSRKIEKKLGGSVRDCIKGKADSRRKNNPPAVLDSI